MDDGHGGTASKLVTVTITGTNDAPVIVAQDLIGAVTEQGTPSGNLTDSGVISFSDVDLTDVHLVSAPDAGRRHAGHADRGQEQPTPPAPAPAAS